MWWFDSLIERPDTAAGTTQTPLIKIKYFYLNQLTRVLEIHDKIVVNEDEFIAYYNLNKSL